MLIYIPRALYISLRNVRSTHFDHAGGEVAYLAIQMASWTAASFWSCVIAAYDENCLPYLRPYNVAVCRVKVANVVFNFIELLISTCWLAMVVHTVRQVQDRPRKEAFKISVNILLREGKEGQDEIYLEDGDSTRRMIPFE